MSAKDVLWLVFFLAVATTFSFAVGTDGQRDAKRARKGSTMESFFSAKTPGAAPAPSARAQPQRVRSFTARLVSPTVHSVSQKSFCNPNPEVTPIIIL